MSALICPRCEKEILPGSPVAMVVPEPTEDQRIFSGDDILIYHEECPND